MSSFAPKPIERVVKDTFPDVLQQFDDDVSEFSKTLHLLDQSQSADIRKDRMTVLRQRVQNMKFLIAKVQFDIAWAGATSTDVDGNVVQSRTYHSQYKPFEYWELNEMRRVAAGCERVYEAEAAEEALDSRSSS